jgi:hypothetical protein
MVQRLSSQCGLPQGRTLTAFSLFPSEDVLETSSEDEDTPSLRAASPSFLPAWTTLPRLEAQPEESQEKHLEEQQQG